MCELFENRIYFQQTRCKPAKFKKFVCTTHRGNVYLQDHCIFVFWFCRALPEYCVGQFLAGLATWYSEAFGSLCYNYFEYVEFHVWNQRIFFREGKTFFLIKRKNVFPSLKPILFKKEKCIIKNIIIISAVKFNLSDFTAFFFYQPPTKKEKNYEDINNIF